jgi:hypothetical protein
MSFQGTVLLNRHERVRRVIFAARKDIVGGFSLVQVLPTGLTNVVSYVHASSTMMRTRLKEAKEICERMIFEKYPSVNIILRAISANFCLRSYCVGRTPGDPLLDWISKLVTLFAGAFSSGRRSQTCMHIACQVSAGVVSVFR